MSERGLATKRWEWTEVLQAVLPAQLPRRRADYPEAALWLAVLEDAVRATFATRDNLRFGREREAALAWLASDAEQVGSFRYCCEVLGADPERVRRALAVRRLRGLPVPFSEAAGRARGAWRIRRRRPCAVGEA